MTLRGGAEVMQGLAEQWQALCDSGGADIDQPFYSPGWIRAYVSAFAPNAEFVVVTVRAANRLVAVLPLISESGTFGGLPARKLRSPGNAHTCRFELVHDPRLTPAVVACVWDALARETGWDVVVLENAPAGGALSLLTAHAAADGHPTHAADALTPPYLDLAPFGGRFDALLETVGAKFRSNLRRRRRKLEVRGALRLTRIETADDGLERFCVLERGGWKGAEESAIACDPATRRFYDGIARDAAVAGELALYALECDGRTVAMYLGIEHRRRYYLLKTAYDETLHDCSPGQLLTCEALRDLVERGCVEFDFLGGDMEWKSAWAPRLRPLADLHIFRGAAGRAMHALRFRVRPGAVKLLRALGARS